MFCPLGQNLLPTIARVAMISSFFFGLSFSAFAQTKTLSLDELFEPARLAFVGLELTTAFEKMHSLAKSGDRRAQAVLSWMFYVGQGVETNAAKAEYWMEKATRSKKCRCILQLSHVPLP